MKQHLMDRIADKLHIEGVHPAFILMIWELLLIITLLLLLSLIVFQIPNTLRNFNFKY
ncbi:hypothetical protein [Lactococcus garvieae]|uniref:hypothetical protein n=1 Tax=Lactococcus garvieae TaxID=1363 RepID=UPI0018DA22D4|nr:hypothetical protein [Lactococcus garvieae]QPS72132.1 hypothetical protein I6G50_04970 [Lactococcus garvieae]